MVIRRKPALPEQRRSFRVQQSSPDNWSSPMASAKATTNHETIRRWAEERGGRPARVKWASEDDDSGVLRLDFGERDPSLEAISWDEFFETFDESDVAFVYEDETADDESQPEWATKH
jgi:hypothetical protein